MKICLIGAYGYTGKIICQYLTESEFDFSICGKDQVKSTEIQKTFKGVKEIISGDITEKGFCSNLFRSYDLIINCAGPFTEESSELLQTAARCGKIYLDITGEIGFVKKSFEDLNDLSLQSGALILHACAFESFIAALQIQKMMNERKSVKGIKVLYEFNQHKISPGTRMTMKMAAYREPLVIKNKKWCISDLQKDRLRIASEDGSIKKTGVPYPLPEIAFCHNDYQSEFAETFLMLEENEAQFFGQTTAKKGDTKSILEELKKFKKPGPSQEERKNQTAALTCVLFMNDNTQIMSQAICSDMYGLTGKCILEIVSEITQNHHIHKQKGVRNPANLFHNKEEDILKRLGVHFNHINLKIE
jgi:short subunit dehydrogenase-like uncharacterized protein